MSVKKISDLSPGELRKIRPMEEDVATGSRNVNYQIAAMMQGWGASRPAPGQVVRRPRSFNHGANMKPPDLPSNPFGIPIIEWSRDIASDVYLGFGLDNDPIHGGIFKCVVARYSPHTGDVVEVLGEDMAKKPAAPKPAAPKPEKDMTPPDWLIDRKEAGVDDVFELFEYNNKYDRGDSELSVTQIIASPRMVALERQNAAFVEAENKVKGPNIYAIMGKAMHKIFEESQPADSLLEERFFMVVDGIKISGSTDRIRKNEDGTYTIIDYKVTSMWSLKDGPKADWENQLNSYAEIVEQVHKIKVRDLMIVAVLRDWSEARKQAYCPSPVVPVRIPSWTSKSRKRYIDKRVSVHQKSLRDAEAGKPLPICGPDDTWDTEESKASFVDTGKYVMEAPKRCPDYCAVKDFCTQYQNHLKSVEAESAKAKDTMSGQININTYDQYVHAAMGKLDGPSLISAYLPGNTLSVNASKSRKASDDKAAQAQAQANMEYQKFLQEVAHARNLLAVMEKTSPKPLKEKPRKPREETPTKIINDDSI